MQRKSIAESYESAHLSPIKQLVEGTNNMAMRKASIATSQRSPSISSQRRPSFAAILASKRFAKQLSNRALRKRSSIFDSTRFPREVIPPKEPTYRMEPERKFQPQQVEDCIKEVMEVRLKGFEYNPQLSAYSCKSIGDAIKSRVKSMDFDRYKIVCFVTIGQRKDQGAQVASRCAWDDKFDNFASYTYKNDSIFCTALVFGVYNE